MIASLLKKVLSQKALEKYRAWRRKQILATFKKNPIKLATNQYKTIFGIDPDLKNPKNLIEKIIWLQFNSDTSLWTLCADKYRVRDYIQKKGLGNILCELYGVWENANDINFDMLPEKFVLKTNNSCGQVIIVKDKSQIDIASTRWKLNKWMENGYGYDNAQMHYTRIKPCIIAEEFLEVPAGKSLNDYKIWSFKGKAECVLVCSDRIIGQGYALTMYDTQWNNISDRALNKKSAHFSGENIDKPQNFELMLEIARELSSDFPEVRVDLYNIEGRIVFGELTFTTGYGSYNKSFYEYLGTKVDLK